MKILAYILLLFIGILACWLRFNELGVRPMHTDEAVGAAKLGLLLDKGTYVYDPYEYHGPTLNYLTLLPAWIAGESSFRELSVETVRQLPLVFGLLLLLLPVLVFRKLDIRLAIVTAFLICISPAMVFYSRYYIHELILVLFTFLGIFAYYQWEESQKWRWSILLGLCVGMMIATKETWVISVAGFLVGIMILGDRARLFQFVRSRHLLFTLAAILVVVVPFFTSFFTNGDGLVDMFRTYETYLGRAGTKELHSHPWYYYLQLLIYNGGPKQLWTELPILLLSCLGGVFLVLKKDRGFIEKSLSIIGVFTLFLVVFYSLLPYKTPWNLLSFYFGWILLAGYGFVSLLEAIASNYLKIAVAAIFGLVSIQLVGQSMNEISEPADPSNPWVYGHTDGDFHQVISVIDSLAVDESTYIEVIFPGHDYWPFPWYLKDYEQVAYRDQVTFDAPGGEMILIAPSLEDQLVEKLYESPKTGERFLYLYLFDSIQTLRPNVYFQGYLRQDLWEKKQNIIVGND